MSKYDDEQQMIDTAIAQVPAAFGLRAFPGKQFRLAPRLSHFVSDGEVQLVVQARMTADEQRKYQLAEWTDFGRNTLAHVLREVTPDPTASPLFTGRSTRSTW